MDNEIIDLVRAVASGFQMRMKEQIAASDATPPAFQARLVNLIGRHDGISQLALGSLTERDKAQIARSINELEAAGLVTRSPSESDRRSKLLSLTPAGKRMHLRFTTMREQLATEALSSLAANEKAALQAALRKVAAHLRPQN